MQLEIDGRRVYAATGGRPFEPALPCVVFVHGAGMDHTVWAMQSRYFAHHGRAVLAVDLPGHGRSDPPVPADIAAQADWLIALLDAAEVEQAALVGHSMGALIVLEAAARQAERVRTLALLGAAAVMPVHPGLLNAAQANDHMAIDLVNAWGHGSGAHLGGHPLAGTWLLGQANRLLERAAPGVLYNDLKACDSYDNGEAAAAAVQCPALVVIGAGDRMTPPKAGRRLAEMLPQGRSLLIPDCGHMMMTEQPQACLDALKRLL